MYLSHPHRQLAPGMEEHVAVLFLDLNDDLLTPCDDDPLSAVRTGELFGEKETTMMKLPIFRKDDSQVSPNLIFVCVWCVCVRTCRCPLSCRGLNKHYMLSGHMS